MDVTELHGVRLGLQNMSLRMKELLVRGKYEEAETRLCPVLLTPDDRVVEIGSAIGFLGLLAARSIGVQAWFSVEANPYTVGLLKANYALNGVVTFAPVLVAALAPKDGPINLHVSEDFWTSSTCDADQESVRQSITVRGCRLSTILGEAPFVPSVLIVDVEGAETCLVSEVIPETVRKMIIEMHPSITGVTESFELLKHLLNQGFEVRGTFDTSYALARQ